MKILPSTVSFKPLLVALLFVSTMTSSFAYAQLSSAKANSAEVIEPISQAELEQILAPIALYPDTILSHILVASTYPLEVVQAERWALRNPELKGQDAVEAAGENDWDPSVQALVAFPQVLKRLSQDLDWTQKLGDAFLNDEEQVLASVQNLRVLAEEAGSLDEMEKVTVSRDKRSIIIEPREREVVYVPYYDTRVVYGPWRWRHYQPVYWGYPYADSIYYDDYYAHHPHSSFFWGPRISLSFGFFFNTFHWSNRHLVRISSRHYRPHRYYGHHDILSHRHAYRWRHNAHRRHANRFNNRYGNRHSDRQVVRRGGGKDDTTLAGHGEEQILSSRAHTPSSQAQIRDRLIDRRDRHNSRVTSRRATVLSNQTVSNRSVNRNVVRATPAPNSRVVLPSRPNSVNSSRTVNRTATTRHTNRAASAPARTQPRPVARPVRPARQQQRVNRPAPPPRAVAAERRSGPAKPRTSARNERRQPR